MGVGAVVASGVEARAKSLVAEGGVEGLRVLLKNITTWFTGLSTPVGKTSRLHFLTFTSASMLSPLKEDAGPFRHIFPNFFGAELNGDAQLGCQCAAHVIAKFGEFC